jgi:hypothetical protein
MFLFLEITRQIFIILTLCYREICSTHFIVPSVLLQWFIKCILKIFVNNRFRIDECTVSVLPDGVESCFTEISLLKRNLF